MRELKEAGKDSAYLPDADTIVEHVAKGAEGGDVVCVFTKWRLWGDPREITGAAEIRPQKVADAPNTVHTSCAPSLFFRSVRGCCFGRRRVACGRRGGCRRGVGPGFFLMPRKTLGHALLQLRVEVIR